MTLELVVDLVRNQFIDIDSESITADCQFKELESYDSLTGMAILSSIEDDFNIMIPVEEYRQLNTIQDIHEYLEKKLL
ncbi:MAG: phosphopantetheine-binding protein [Spirosomataceae bacterium]